MDSNHRDLINKQKANTDQLLEKLKRIENENPKAIDDKFLALHNKVFEKIDCLTCANCCKTTSPIFELSDINKIAHHLSLTIGDFITTFLHMDEDGDFVLNSAPCTFLGEDNKCKIYNFRPKACREYPHTNRKNMIEIMDITYQNALICPAVAKIVEEF